MPILHNDQVLSYWRLELGQVVADGHPGGRLGIPRGTSPTVAPIAYAAPNQALQPPRIASPSRHGADPLLGASCTLPRVTESAHPDRRPSDLQARRRSACRPLIPAPICARLNVSQLGYVRLEDRWARRRRSGPGRIRR